MPQKVLHPGQSAGWAANIILRIAVRNSSGYDARFTLIMGANARSYKIPDRHVFNFPNPAGMKIKITNTSTDSRADLTLIWVNRPVGLSEVADQPSDASEVEDTTTYPPFIEAHPPLMTDRDTFPPERSDFELVGAMQIQQGDFDRVYDPHYPWQDLLSYTNTEAYQQMMQYKASRDAEIDHYCVSRRRYWLMTDRKFFANDTQLTVVHHTGFTRHSSRTSEENFTQRIGGELGLSIKGDLLNPEAPPDIPPVAGALATGPANAKEDEGNGDDGGSSVDTKFTWEMSHELRFTRVDEQTYVFEDTVTTFETFKEQSHYLSWQIYEEIAVQAVKKGQTGDPDDTDKISVLEAQTPVEYIQRFALHT